MIYMPMIPEAAAAMLACARIGAVHSVVFGGFSPESLAGRIADCDACAVITADEGVRGGKPIPLEAQRRHRARGARRADRHRRHPHRRRRADEGRPRRLVTPTLRDQLATDCEPEVMNAEDPLFILYTSGSTGKPKGVVHTTGGYAVWAATTFDWVFDYRPDDIFWCTADIGWITGHSYVVYGPLAMGATSVMFDGVPNYPDFGRFWETVDRLGVTIFYTAPTAIRALMREGDEPVKRHSRKSLRLLGTVGEPINPEAWEWYWRVVGDEPLPDRRHLVADGDRRHPDLAHSRRDADEARIGDQAAAGHRARAGRCRATMSSKDRRAATCALPRPGRGRCAPSGATTAASSRPISRPIRGLYFTGDGCRRDEDGYYWITGRVDDVINVSGHRIGTAEVESSLVSHPKVAEAAVVGYPARDQGPGDLRLRHPQRRRGRRRRVAQGARSRKCATTSARFAAPEKIQFTPALPKTRSGKIMRRILRKIAEGATDGFGDTSTLADPGVVDALAGGPAMRLGAAHRHCCLERRRAAARPRFSPGST